MIPTGQEAADWIEQAEFTIKQCKETVSRFKKIERDYKDHLSYNTFDKEQLDKQINNYEFIVNLLEEGIALINRPQSFTRVEGSTSWEDLVK